MSKPKKSLARENRRGKRLRAANNNRAIDQFERMNPPARPHTGRKVLIAPLNDAQREYDAAIRTSQVIFGVGPAGTGKTWFAAMRAAEALDKGEIEKIIITRPAVEAGESLGFLPGELEEKYEPYIRPVRDALEEYFGKGRLEYLLKNETIEARPLAYIRGSTIKNAWLLADEMQNATTAQFKMLLSRIGENAKFIVNGDPRQSDLPRDTSGLMNAQRKLAHVEGITSVEFFNEDIVRSGICQAIVEALEGA